MWTLRSLQILGELQYERIVGMWLYGIYIGNLLMTYATYDYSTLRPPVWLKDDYNNYYNYDIRKVINIGLYI